MPEGWRFWIDRGGTFTDCVGVDPRGRVHVHKTLSSDQAPLIAIRAVMGLAADAPIPGADAPGGVLEVRLGTTLATNALLERRGVDTALVITAGFEDLLQIGDQTRPELFRLDIQRPPPLAAKVIGTSARGGPNGERVSAPDPEPLRRALEVARADGLRSAAVVVLHATRQPALEDEIGAVVRAAGFEHVSLSHEVDAEPGLLARAETTVVDAYLTPLLRDYVRQLAAALPGTSLRIMQSSGALTTPDGFRGRNAVLSGPAGGAVALAALARRAGLERAIGFDMGGTSTDVCRFEDEPELTYQTRIGGVRLRAPMMAIHTVAAGGGSLCRYDGRRMTVGPESAGARPGPLAYGHPDAREPTLTDANLVLGRLVEDRFPFPLDAARARAAFETIARETGGSAEEVAAGFVRVAIESMAEAIRRVTTARGHDPRTHGLVVFGGAGGQHACAVARRLGIRRVLLHPLDGVLSAYGIGVAPVGWHGEADLGGEALSREVVERAGATLERLLAEGRAAIGEDAVGRAKIGLRYRGTEHDLEITWTPDEGALRAAFEARHRSELGHVRSEHPVVANVARMEVSRSSAAPLLPLASSGSRGGVEPIARRALHLGEGDAVIVDVHDRDALPAGTRLRGPCLLVGATSVLVLEPGFSLVVTPDGVLDLTDEGTLERHLPRSTEVADPVELEIFANTFMSIAEEMGLTLARLAMSTNIRERLDFSCAVFDADGNLVANAPHIPVHLGAMGETVKAVIAAHPDPSPGDVFASNHPAAGGSHLPDITVVTPVFIDGERAFFVASRGHHADVGGITPGSMPPFSRALDEEGVVFDRTRIVDRGALDRAAILAILESGPYPARRPHENLADLSAQIAANQRGAALLERLAGRVGGAVVARYMAFVQDAAAAEVRDAIARLPDGTRELADQLDEGAVIRVRVTVAGDHLTVDFTGTSAELADENLNAPRAVTVAAVLYVIRCLVGSSIPLNAGCLRPVSLSVEEGSLLAPGPERAIAGGNVETSQRIVDVLLGALQLAAASQGTMNNLTFGDERFGYYETIAGGAGAGPGFDGASCVHTHMTNSRITDPEILEARFPVRLTRFARRYGSGGAGRWRGGDGVIREIEALRPLSFSILSERRTRAPFGLAGGGEGQPGANQRMSPGDERALPGRVTVTIGAGERIRVETPGGGGYGT